LGDILDAETLAVIQAGSAERIGTAVTIVDAAQREAEADRVDPINLSAKYAPFCRLFRDPQAVEGGNAACERCDAQVGRAALTSERQILYRSYTCHMGVLDARHLVLVCGQPVAVLFAGQFRPPEGTAHIHDQVREIAAGRRSGITLRAVTLQHQLIALADQLQPPPADFAARLQREAHYISRLAEAQFESVKRRWEQSFLDELRSIQPPAHAPDLPHIRTLAEQLLTKVRKFCRCAYVAVFANLQENDTVLIPLAQSGLPTEAATRLPHFNWNKAGLPLEEDRSSAFAPRQGALLRGIRGDGRTLLERVAFLAPASLGKLYRSVVAFGPFAEAVDVAHEEQFLMEISRIISWLLLSEVQVLNLQKQQLLSENRVKLLTHQLRTAITPIATHVGAAKLLQNKLSTQDQTTRTVAKYLSIAQEMCISLARAATATLNSQAVLLERDDLKLELYPLSVLVANCAAGFEARAAEHQRRLMVEDSVELLPTALIDVARFTIAFSNLIENAIKYSFPGTRIVIRAGDRQERLDLNHAIIEVQDEGDDIPADKVESIFEAGTRLLTGVKMRQIPGTGLGLWEARAVVEAHGGKIAVRSVPSTFFYRQKRAQRVTFLVRIPLQQVSRQVDR
jgi:signal transduction histidine kinase